jgi:transcriptional regulator with XRE-family HTH domain
MNMHYTQFFRGLREGNQLGQEELAVRAGRHRNTVTNVESGRPVKFKTIAELMQAMGFGRDSRELRQIALLWLEDVAGVQVSPQQAKTEIGRLRSEYRAAVADDIQALNQAISRQGLSRERIRLLRQAAETPEMLDILRAIQDLLTKKIGDEPSHRKLLVAEEK